MVSVRLHWVASGCCLFLLQYLQITMCKMQTANTLVPNIQCKKLLPPNFQFIQHRIFNVRYQ